MQQRFRRTAGLCLPILLAHAACSGSGSSGGSAQAVCPTSAIIHGLDRLTGEVAGGRSFSVLLENIDGVCTHSDSTLKLDMTIDLVVDAPSGTGIPYFVVVSDPAGQVLDKVNFTAVVPADAPTGVVRLRERLYQEVAGVAAGTSVGYTILFGLDLPPDIALEQRAL